MTVYYVRHFAVLPTASDSKLWREILILKSFADDGHDVELLYSRFDHYQKKFRSGDEKPSFSKLKYKSLPAIGYKKNKSVRRVLDNWVFALNLFFYLLRRIDHQDLIICSYPTPESALSCKIACVLSGARITYDFRDAWPSALGVDGMISRLFSVYIGILNRLIFCGEKKGKNVAMSQGLAEYYRRYLGREGPRVMPNPFNIPACSTDFESESLDINIEKNKKTICFVGSLNNQFTFQPIYDYYSEFPDSELQTVIAGDGEDASRLQIEFEIFPQVKFIGSVEYREALSLMVTSAASFAFYKNPRAFENHLTNKIVEGIMLRRPMIHNLSSSIFSLGNACFSIGWTIKEMPFSEIVARVVRSRVELEVPLEVLEEFRESSIKETLRTLVS